MPFFWKRCENIGNLSNCGNIQCVFRILSSQVFRLKKAWNIGNIGNFGNIENFFKVSD